MSAIISMKGEDAIFLFTDGAIYDRHYIMREFKRKVAISHRVPIAVATRGSEFWSQHGSAEIIGWAENAGVDEAIATFAESAPIWKLKADFSNILEVVIAAWSPTAGPIHRVFSNLGCRTYDGKEIDWYKQDILFDPGQTFLGYGTDGVSSWKGVLRPQDQGEGVVAYAADCGIRLMQYFRRLRLSPNEWDADRGIHYCLGGHVDLTLVNEFGVVVQRIHTWPEDRIGEKINPFAGQNVAPIAAGMSRQQRRAAEREARKVRAA